MQERSLATTEIIVVDNASSDGSPQTVQKLFPKVTVIQNTKNLGFAAGCNTGIKASTGAYISLINSDIVVSEGCFDQLRTYMLEHPGIGLVGPRILAPEGKAQRSCMGFPSIWNNLCRALCLDVVFRQSRLFGGLMQAFTSHDAVRNVDVINGCFWMVRREALSKVGLLDERFFMYAEDIDWCKRFHVSGWGVVLLQATEVFHYGGGSSSNSPIRFYIEMQKANLQYWEKYHRRASQSAYRLILWLHQILRVLIHSVLFLLRPSSRRQTSMKIRRSFSCLCWLSGLSTLSKHVAD